MDTAIIKKEKTKAIQQILEIVNYDANKLKKRGSAPNEKDSQLEKYIRALPGLTAKADNVLGVSQYGGGTSKSMNYKKEIDRARFIEIQRILKRVINDWIKGETEDFPPVLFKCEFKYDYTLGFDKAVHCLSITPYMEENEKNIALRIQLVLAWALHGRPTGIILHCPECGNLFYKNDKRKEFCTRKCAGRTIDKRRAGTEERKELLRLARKKAYRKAKEAEKKQTKKKKGKKR